MWFEWKIELIECYHAIICGCNCAATNKHKFRKMWIVQNWNGKFCYNNSKKVECYSNVVGFYHLECAF